ncbi:Uncharacterized protein Adt_20203 [Abeliophyllum distichum]|uniref:Uncharacterized protein n=1 Tax=Abeliophyllum distichum TaxID=126358 RepID=A0ABD1SVW6_9LAMI
MLMMEVSKGFRVLKKRTFYKKLLMKKNLWAEREIILTDFPYSEMVNLINSCGWQKVSKPHLAYLLLVKEFISNFNHAIEEPEADHRYTTWVRGFSPAVIEIYYGLTVNDIEHVPAELEMALVTQFLYGRADAWPIVGPKFLHN